MAKQMSLQCSVCGDSTWNPFNGGSGVCRQKRWEALEQLGGLFTWSVLKLGSVLPSLGRRKKCSGDGMMTYWWWWLSAWVHFMKPWRAGHLWEELAGGLTDNASCLLTDLRLSLLTERNSVSPNSYLLPAGNVSTPTPAVQPSHLPVICSRTHWGN